jgi:hypothetical protein
MKRILINLMGGLLTLTLGLAAASFWNWLGHMAKHEPSAYVNMLDERPSFNQISAGSIAHDITPSEREVAFGRGLKLVSDEV